jgi:hypothetical protein
MDIKRLLKDNRGVSLMEVTLAVAIFAGVIGVTAQSLASFYVTIDVQEQRMEAVSASRSVMDALREKRAEFTENFPEDLIEWVDAGNESEWEEFLVDNEGHVELSEQVIEVLCLNRAGDEAGVGDNPLVVHVTTTWQDRKGRTLSAQVVSMLTSD